MSQSATSSISSEDQFAVLRTSNTGDVEVSLAKTTRQPPPAATAKTPLMKTPTMETLTKKWEFLLEAGGSTNKDEDVDSTPDGDSYFQTPPHAAKLQRAQSYGSRQSIGSRQSSRSGTPTRQIVKPVLSAQKILSRLNSPEDMAATPLMPSASPSWDKPKQQQPLGTRHRSPQIKQNLEQRLRLLEEDGKEKSSSIPIPQHHRTPPRQPQHRARPSPLKRGQFGWPTKNQQQQQSKQPPSQQQQDLSPHKLSTATSTTIVMSEVTGVHMFPDSTNLDSQEDYQEEKKGEAFENEEGEASFWHRWKMAEKLREQQRDQFEREKVEWERQLESAYDANSKIDALRKRMEVQLLAVHKTCFKQDEEDDLSEDDRSLLAQESEAPIDPLHLLMLQKSGALPGDTNVEDFNLALQGSDESDNHSSTRDSTDYTRRLERRMTRTKTKNCILTHLVKLIERQTEEQKQELEERLKMEKEEREDLMREFENLERRLEEQSLKESHAAIAKKMTSPVPTEKDQTKALQNRLWLREQQYEQERKEFDAKIKSLRAENDRFKEQVEQQLHKPIPRKKLKAQHTIHEKRVEALQKELICIKSEKSDLQSKHDALQTKFVAIRDELQRKVDTTEREQRRKHVKQMQEVTHLENQLSKAQKEAERNKANHEESLERLKELQSLVNLLETEKVEREDSDASAELMLRDLEQRYNGEKQDWIEEVGRLQGESTSKSKQISDLQSRLEESNDELQKRVVEKTFARQEEDEQGFTRQLEEEITHLEFSLQVERENLEDARNENFRFEEEIQQLKRDHANELNQADRRVREVLEAEHAGRRLSTLTLDQDMMKEKYEDLDSQLLEVTQQLETCLSSLEAESSKCAKLKETNDALELEMELMSKEHLEQNKKWESTAQTLQAERDSCAGANHLLEDMSRKRQEVEVQWQQTNSELDAALKSLEVEDVKCRELEERNSELNNQFQQLNERFIGEMKELEARIADSREAQSQLLERSSSLEAMLNESKEAQLDLRAKNDSLEQCVQQLNYEKETEASRAHDLEERNQLLDSELQQLNDRFIGEMKEMEVRYQSLLSESFLAKEQNAGLQRHVQELTQSLEETSQLLLNVSSRVASQEKAPPEESKSLGRDCVQDSQGNADEVKSLGKGGVDKQRAQASPSDVDHEPMLRELREENSLLEAKLELLKNEVSASTTALKRSTEKISSLESSLAELTDEYAKEKLEWESQLQSCESNDTARTQELIQQKEEREHQLDEAKKEVEAGLRKLSAQSDEYRAAVKKIAELDSETKHLRLEKKDWQLKLQSIIDDNKRVQDLLSVKNGSLEQQIIDLQETYDQGVKDWNLAKDHQQKETVQMQQRYNEQLVDLKSQVAAAEQLIETMRNMHEAEKHEWKEHARTESEHTATSFSSAFLELKGEVLKMGEQIAVSNQGIKELTTKRSVEEDILTGFDRMQLDLAETARKIAEDAKDIGENRSAVAQRLEDIEKSLTRHQEDLLEQVKGTSQRSDAAEIASLRQKSIDDLRQYEADLARAKDEIQKLSVDIELQKIKRETAEKEIAELRDQLRRSLPPPVVEIKCGSDHEDLQVEDGDDTNMDGLDTQLADLSAKIEKEMEEIRCICSSTISDGLVDAADDSEELVGARQAMFAQTLLLVQSMRHLLVDSEAETEDDQSAAVLQHLEILSELMGQVDILEGDTKGEDVNQMQLVHRDQSADAVDPNTPLGEGVETDLLQFELGEDISIDLLQNVSQEDEILRITAGAADSTVIHEDQTAFPGKTDSVDDEREETTSPIELYVEQNFHRCQQLERERADLINTTLDLLSASREANKAEIDAALATARRKASEEMIQMRAQVNTQVEQIWSRLCDKCRQGLVQG